jgi:hypothetical protein
MRRGCPIFRTYIVIIIIIVVVFQSRLLQNGY